MKTLVVVAMKCVDAAKTRLAGELDDDARRALAWRLFTRTLGFFTDCYPTFGRLVITPCAEVAAHAERAGWMALRESEPQGLNAAASEALAWARAQGFDRLLFVPADVPDWDLKEVSALLRAAHAHPVVIARAHDNGTNGLLLDVAVVNGFDFQYGPDSASLHAQACEGRGVRHATLLLPKLAHDLDTIEDCRRLASALSV